MKRINHLANLAVSLSIILLVACTGSSTNAEKKEKEGLESVAKNETPSMPAYDAAMDPLVTGAAFCKKLADTLGIKMYEFTLNPGDSVSLHNHPDHTAYVLQGGKMAIIFKGAETQIFDLTPGWSITSGPVADAAKNVGNTTIKMLIHDIYRPR